MAQVWVLGSINADRTVAVAKLPQPGETVLAGAIGEASGGKGANQAVAAAKLGAATALIGRVGEDAIGEILLQDLQTSGVDVSRVAIDSLAPTGQAWIAVDGLGQNQIIVLPGANQAVGGAEVDRLQRSLGSAPRPIALLLQLEVPLAAVVAAAQAGQAAGAIVLLDPAPAPEHLPPELWAAIDWITPNATEAAQLVGFPVQTPEDAARAATRLQELGAKGAIVTLGEQGAWVAGPTDCFWQPAFPVRAIDSVAAGDGFNGALAAALVAGQPLSVAVRRAAAAGALTTTRSGAQSALPNAGELTAFLAQNASN
ncbi:ribokinase [Limnothrix sp. FACHB-881]|uniref:ribokinase n=1 Tax=unclassified Limnothrix TaxID=2632864 RepID=UPI00081EB0E8|nr:MULTISPECIES: ribokinase [unclassified Limnothrix]OCQ90328.1 hypothetical protein BCR12_15820 [Limnothrix sp. P13C2]MBD2555093.1 ribokinase [Limnothrix sp. FACHB-708]MBD2592537.1 ribokinase [Limnothrix sp. FACHB-406]MBD2636109.1 ribokinase [Limnothrix sp. FACHB-881]PIB04605.1 hypothetical protein AMR42_17010 [Limnothrix sp. PR1529]